MCVCVCVQGGRGDGKGCRAASGSAMVVGGHSRWPPTCRCPSLQAQTAELRTSIDSIKQLAASLEAGRSADSKVRVRLLCSPPTPACDERPLAPTWSPLALLPQGGVAAELREELRTLARELSECVCDGGWGVGSCHMCVCLRARRLRGGH